MYRQYTDEIYGDFTQSFGVRVDYIIVITIDITIEPIRVPCPSTPYGAAE